MNVKLIIKWLCLLLGQVLIFYITFKSVWRTVIVNIEKNQVDDNSVLSSPDDANLLFSNAPEGFLPLSNFSSSTMDSESFKFTQQLENWNEKITSDSVKKLLEILIDYKYSDSNYMDERRQSIQKVRELKFPIRIYVYSLSDNQLLERTLEMCEKHYFDNENMTFFPHAYIDCYLLNFIRNSPHQIVEKVDDLEQADLAYIPLPLVMNYYDNFKHEQEKDFMQFLTNKIKTHFYNELMDHHHQQMENNFDKVPHFVTYSYVSFRVSFHSIPKFVKIITLENVAITGPPQHAWYDNGCYDRCLTIPYITIFDWPSYRGGLNPLELDHTKDWTSRPYLLSFIGSLNRTEILFTHRYHLVSKLSAFKTQFHTFKESISTSSNTEIYGKSKFCLQLHGDTPTRNAFYESLLMGCIPVITEKTFLIYRSLFGYLLPVDEFTIVIDNKYAEEHVSVKEIIDQLEHLNASGKYLRMLNIFKSLAFFLRYKIEQPNLLPLLSILSAQLPLSIPPKYRKEGEIELFMGRPITNVYNWIYQDD